MTRLSSRSSLLMTLALVGLAHGTGCTEKKVVAVLPPPTKAPPAVRSRFYLGIRARTRPVGADGARPSGVMVRSVVPGSPADIAGLSPGDVIVGLNRRAVTSPRSLTAVMDQCQVGEPVALKIRRGAAESLLEIRFVEGGAEGLSRSSIASGASFLASAHTDGAFPHFHDQEASSAVTALAGWALAEAAATPEPPAEVLVARDATLARLSSLIAKDGGIGDPTRAIAHRCYASACALLAFARADPKGEAKTIQGLAAYLSDRQIDEGEGYDVLDWRYGAFPYYESSRSEALRTDMSTVAYVVQALDAAGLAEDAPLWRRLGFWLDEAQNFGLRSVRQADRLRESPLRDGGFAFSPRNSKSGQDPVGEDLVVYRSYGSATADGLRSLIALEGSATSDRAIAALYWLGRHYDIKKNPGFQKGLGWDKGIDFYYLHSLAQALDAAGVRAVKLPDGAVHDWPDELIRSLALRQKKDGSWRNSSKLMNEHDPVLATSMAVLALVASRRALLREDGYTLAAPAAVSVPPEPTAETSSRDPVLRGLGVYQRSGCTGCHRDGARDRGPSLLGVGDRFLAKYQTPIAARSYLRKHFRDPTAFPGTRPWPGETMPAFKEETLPGPTLEDLITFLLSRKGPAPVSQALLPGQDQKKDLLAGQALYERLGCASCHGPQGHGPDLSGLRSRYLQAKGSESAARDALAAHIRDPKGVPSLDPARRPGASMPAYSARALSEAALGDLLDYLMGRGG